MRIARSNAQKDGTEKFTLYMKNTTPRVAAHWRPLRLLPVFPRVPRFLNVLSRLVGFYDSVMALSDLL